MNQIIVNEPNIKFRNNLVQSCELNISGRTSVSLINNTVNSGLYKVITGYYWCGTNTNTITGYCWTGFDIRTLCNSAEISKFTAGPGCVSNYYGYVDNMTCSNQVFETFVYVPSNNTNITVDITLHNVEDFAPNATGASACVCAYLTKLI